MRKYSADFFKAFSEKKSYFEDPIFLLRLMTKITIHHGVDANDVWVGCHTSQAIIDLLCQTFEGHLISGNGDVAVVK